MVSIDIVYQGDLRCHATHGPSGTTLYTDAPVDNHGKGETFSPTDLCATALGTCMATIMGLIARNLGIDLAGMRIRVGKTMSSDLPRRISRLDIEISVPLGVSSAQRPALINAAETCPVFLSLHPEILKNINFIWD